MANEMHEMLRRFHNQKDPDFRPESETTNPVGRRKVDYEKQARFEGNTEYEDVIAQSILMLRHVDLKPEVHSNAQQIELLQKRKEFALSSIRGVFDAIAHYIAAIHALDSMKVRSEESGQKEYLAQLVSLDQHRTHMHDALIRSLQGTIKFIQYNFGKISEKALEDWEEQQEEQGIPVLAVRRVEFPPKVLCPENINLHDRRQITSWASQLALSLGQLKKGLTE